MSYGFTVLNSNNYITISDAQLNPQYVGQAVYQNSGWWIWTTGGSQYVQMSGGLGTGVYGETYLRIAVAVYTITYPTSQGKPFPFIVQDSTINYGAAINAIKATGTSGNNTTWTIYVNICNGYAMTAASQPKILVFASIPEATAPTGYGLVVKTGSGSIAFNSNLKHLVASAGISYPTSTLINAKFGGSATNYYPMISYNSSVTILNLPTTPAFFYQTGFTDFPYNGSGNGYYYASAVGRINGSNFESSCGFGGGGITNVGASIPRTPNPVIFIDSSKYI